MLCGYITCFVWSAGYSFDVPRTPSFDDLYLFNTSTKLWKSLTPQQHSREWPKPRSQTYQHCTFMFICFSPVGKCTRAFKVIDFDTILRSPRWLISLAPSLADGELYLFGGTGHGLTGVIVSYKKNYADNAAN